MTIRSILVVDDDPDTLKAMLQVLEPQGYAVSVAVGGQEAIRSLDRKPVDLVITDIVMPEGDGFELVTALRKNFPDTRVVAVSGGGNLSPDTYLVIARGFGVDAVLQKPVMHDELMTAIKGVERRPWQPLPRDKA
jgi:CheY-like chemotaxis protein